MSNGTNILDMCDRIFYTKDNGEVFACFKNKPMQLISIDELNELMEHERQNQTIFVSIAEQQVRELKNIFKDKNLRKVAINQELTIRFYNDYKIISDQEFKELINFLKN